MAKVFVGIGSNIDKRANVVGSVRALASRFGALTLSPVFESDAVGFDGDSFYNMVVAFETGRPPDEVAAMLGEVEHAHGRWRGKERFCSRTLDLDQLLYGDLVLDNGAMRLPHADVTKHAYVLRPLASLAGDILHVAEGKTYAQLWAECEPAAPQLVKVDLPELRTVRWLKGMS